MGCRHCAIAGLLASALVSWAGLATAQAPSDPQFVMRGDEPTGSHIRRRAVTTEQIPINLKYSELSQEEKAIIASWYEHMAPGDEPPFPADGLKPLFDAVYRGQRHYLARGQLLIYASVSPSGDVEAVKIFKSPDPDVTKFVARVLMLTKFKPAVCGGVACRMDYPFLFDFKVD